MMPESAPATAYEWLNRHLDAADDRPVLSVWRNGNVVTSLDGSALLALANGVAAGLRSRQVGAGDRVLICLANDEQFVSTVLGCLALGAIAVPGPIPGLTRADAFRERLRGIDSDCEPRLTVTRTEWIDNVSFALVPGSVSGRVAAWSELIDPTGEPPTEQARTQVAFLQYTSGSTAAPKGVVITHAAIQVSCRQAAQVYAERPDDTAVTWVPLYHDMGLVTGLLRPLFSAYHSVLLTPDEFVLRPASWLDAISTCGGTLSSAPNFAYDLCVRKTAEVPAGRWDLSRWRVARNAGEVVRPETMDRFAAKFASAGFRTDSFCPSYGMAEATLTVTTSTPESPPRRIIVDSVELDHDAGVYGSRRKVLLSSGSPVPGTDVSVVDRRGRWQVGEIVVRGPQLSPGYWRQGEIVPRGDAESLHTGDIGFLHEGHLFVLGRVADRFSHLGRNYFLADIQAAGEMIDGIRSGRIAVFLSRTPESAADVVCAVAEVSPTVEPTARRLAELSVALRRQLATKLDLYVSDVRFVRAGQLPVTTSGKVRVAEVRRRWHDGTLPTLNSSGGALERVRIDVTFTGSRAGEAPLTWGQSAIWTAMARNKQTWNLSFELDLCDARTDVPAVTAALRRLLARHEALRTVIRGTGDHPRQVLLNAGSLPVDVLSCADGEVAELTQRVVQEQTDRAFLHATELPLRATLIVVADLVRTAVLTYSHMAADYAAIQLVHQDLRSLLNSGAPAFEVGAQPLDIARDEHGPDAERVGARAARYWEKQLERLPTTMWTPVGPPREPRLQHAVLTSIALPAAARRIAARHRTTPSTVVLAASAMVTAVWNGHSVAALNLTSANRSRPRYRHAVANLVQLGLFVLDVPPGATLDEIMPAAAQASLRAHQYAYYDFTALSGVRERIDAERGAEVHPLACFNAEDRTFDEDFDQEEVDLSQDGSTVTWRADVAQSRCHFCLRLGARFGGSRGISLTADTSRLPPERIEAFLRELESLVLAGSTDAAVR
jgi:acyl-CoA synthetase (AMP-forming)/AMP-acid ligase II